MTGRTPAYEGDGLPSANDELDSSRIRFAPTPFFAAAMVLVLAATLAASAIIDEPDIVGRKPSVQQLQEHPTPTPPPLLLKRLSYEAAVEFNRRIPLAAGVTAAARPFKLVGDNETRARALECLTAAVYYEAALESRDGRRAVAQVVLNRVRHPAFPASICGVVFEGSTRLTGCQFTFACDGSLMRPPVQRLWSEARTLAWEALSGAVYAPVGLATHYHANYVVPYWATSLAKNAEIGRHIFYRWRGDWGHPIAFRQRPSGLELDPHRLKASALMAKGVWPFDSEASSERVIEATVDQHVELAGVLALLARAQTADESSYEKAARKYFANHSTHPAVETMRGAQASGVAPARSGDAAFVQASVPMTGLSTAPAASTDGAMLSSLARDFGRQSNLTDFLQHQRSAFEHAGAQLNRAAMNAADLWGKYTRVPVKGRNVVISLSSVNRSSLCLLGYLGAPELPLLSWSSNSTGAAPAEIFIRTHLAQGILKSRNAESSTSIDQELEEQVVRAVFARIQALMLGERAGADQVSKAVERGHALVPLFVQRLTEYEKKFSEYRDLNEFLPVLVAGVERNRTSPQNRHSAVGDLLTC